MADLADLGGTADLILSAFVNQLGADGVEVPDRQLVHAGVEAVWDGEQIAVGLVDIKQGQPGAPMVVTMQPQAIQFFAEWHVVILRPVVVLQEGPQVQPPDEELHVDGLAAMADVQALVKATSEIYQQHVITGVGEGFVLAGCRPVGPQGGLAGSELLLHTTVR